MATYNPTTKIFTLDTAELNFTIPANLGDGSPTPVGTGIQGNDLANVLRGDATANTTIDGGKGDDTIEGGAGADTLWGGEGIDTLSYEHYVPAAGTIGVNVTLQNPGNVGIGADEGDQKGDNFKDFEYLLGSAFDDTLSGNIQDNSITGGAGNDILVGKGGNDTLVGGVGADDMQGLADNDLYYVDNALDAVRENGGQGYDTVITYVTFDLQARGNGEVEVLRAVAGSDKIDLYGNYHTNLIIGNDAGNIIDGRSGVDTMQGGAGSDTYYVDVSSDQVSEIVVGGAGDAGGYDQVLTKDNFTLTAYVEKLEALAGAFKAISLTGNDLANLIIGNEYANVINGGTGADVMEGGAGNDTYFVDDAGDVVSDSSGSDAVHTWINYTLASSAEILRAEGSVGLSLTGNAFANTIYGNDGANVINGSAGKDTLYGGKGKDTFVFNTRSPASHYDKLADFSSKDDTIKLENAVFTKLKAGTLKSSAFWKGAKAHDKDDRIIYDSSKGKIYYDADGTGSSKQVLVATVKAKTALYASDFVVI
jgi:Ca2+-binding RTX toxin-like protein